MHHRIVQGDLVRVVNPARRAYGQAFIVGEVRYLPVRTSNGLRNFGAVIVDGSGTEYNRTELQPVELAS